MEKRDWSGFQTYKKSSKNSNNSKPNLKLMKDLSNFGKTSSNLKLSKPLKKQTNLSTSTFLIKTKKKSKKESWTCWQWEKCKNKKLNKNPNNRIEKLNMKKLWWTNNKIKPCKTKKTKMMKIFQVNKKWMRKTTKLLKKLMKHKRSNNTKISDQELKCFKRCHIHHHFITLWYWPTQHPKVGWCTFLLYWTPQLLRKSETNSWKPSIHSLKLKIRTTCGSVGSIWKWFWVILWAQLRKQLKIMSVQMFISEFFKS